MIFARALRASCTIAIFWLTAGCATGEPKAEQENKFYKSVAVRRCLQYEKERLTTQAEECWAELLSKLEREPEFLAKAELSDDDVNKIRRKAGQSQTRSRDMKRELNACFNLPSRSRQKRVECFKRYLAEHKGELSQGERYEIEAAISATREAEKRAAGEVEATIEHAGKLLGAEMHTEDGGVRIDAITGDPMAQAQCPVQGMIVLIDELQVAEMDAGEIIGRLEACQDKPVRLLVRHGGLKEVSFYQLECRCGQEAAGKRLWSILQPEEACTEADSPELSFGIEWCYEASTGELHVESVCAGSPAAAAGVLPRQIYTHINDQLLLGKSFAQIRALLEQPPLRFSEKGGSLSSPAPLDGERIDKAVRERCWQAIQTLNEEAGKAAP